MPREGTPPADGPSVTIEELQRLLYANRCRMPAGAPEWLADKGAFCGALALAAYAEGGRAPTPDELLGLAEAFRDLFAGVSGEVPISHAIDDFLVELGFRPFRGEKTALRRIAEVSRTRGRVDLRLATATHEAPPKPVP
ncbi:MAG TPA: hypothetical protein VGE72_11645 [Azospirillum sp.]